MMSKWNLMMALLLAHLIGTANSWGSMQDVGLFEKAAWMKRSRSSGRLLQQTKASLFMKFEFFINVTEPSQEEVEGILCQLDQALHDKITPTFDNPCLILYVSEITWNFDANLPPDLESETNGTFPFEMIFYLDGVSRDGAPIPPVSELLEQWENVYGNVQELQTLITDYFWKADEEGRFTEVEEVRYRAEEQLYGPGNITKVYPCPNAPPPPDCATLSPTVTAAPITPSAIPSRAPVDPTDPNVGPGGTYYPTRAPAVLVVGENTVATQFVMSFKWFPGENVGREPTVDEVIAVMCKANVYFFNLFRRGYIDNLLQYDSLNVDWVYDEEEPYPVNITFGANVTRGNGQVPPEETTLEIFDENKDINHFIEEYVWDAEPVGSNMFYFTESMLFVVENLPVPIGRIASIDELCVFTPEPTHSPLSRLGGVILPLDLGLPSDEGRLASFTMDMELANGREEPSESEMEGLACAINEYLRDLISPYTNATEVFLNAVAIDWDYNADGTEPLRVYFSVNATDVEGRAWPAASQIVEIWNNHFDMQVFLEQYVQQSEPAGASIFSQTEGVMYVADAEEMDQATRMASTSHCGQLTTIPLGRIEMIFSFQDGNAQRPTSREMEALICQTNLYFRDMLERALPSDEFFAFEMMGIDWEWVEDATTPLRVIMHARSTDIDGMPFPTTDFMYITFLENADPEVYVRDYVRKAEPRNQNVFFYTEEVQWGTQLRSPGVSKLVSGACIASTQPPLAGIGVSYGFFDDITPRAPSTPEISGLMCQTNQYIRDVLQREMPDFTFSITAVAIDWMFTQISEEPVYVTFSIQSRLDNGTIYPSPPEVVSILDRTFNVKSYIQDYVWNSEPENNNLFYDTESVTWNSAVSVPDASARLVRAGCPDDGLPDFVEESDRGFDDEEDDGLDWWHWLLMTFYLLLLFCLVWALIQCYCFLLPELDERGNMLDEDDAKEEDMKHADDSLPYQAPAVDDVPESHEPRGMHSDYYEPPNDDHDLFEIGDIPEEGEEDMNDDDNRSRPDEDDDIDEDKEFGDNDDYHHDDYGHDDRDRPDHEDDYGDNDRARPDPDDARPDPDDDINEDENFSSHHGDNDDRAGRDPDARPDPDDGQGERFEDDYENEEAGNGERWDDEDQHEDDGSWEDAPDNDSGSWEDADSDDDRRDIV